MGLATAQCLAEDGARVALVGRSQAVLDEAPAKLTRLGSPEAVGVVADVTDVGQVDEAFGRLGARWNGALNVLINTVGPSASGAFVELTDDRWRSAIDDGVMGWCTACGLRFRCS